KMARTLDRPIRKQSKPAIDGIHRRWLRWMSSHGCSEHSSPTAVRPAGSVVLLSLLISRFSQAPGHGNLGYPETPGSAYQPAIINMSFPNGTLRLCLAAPVHTPCRRPHATV